MVMKMSVGTKIALEKLNLQKTKKHAMLYLVYVGFLFAISVAINSGDAPDFVVGTAWGITGVAAFFLLQMCFSIIATKQRLAKLAKQK